MKVASTSSTDVIVLCVAVMVGSTIIRHIQEKPKDVGKGYAQPIVYGFFLMFALLVLAVPAPRFAKGLSYMGLVGAFAVNGPAIYKLAGGK